MGSTDESTVLSDDDVGSDHTERADDAAIADPGIGVNHGPFVDLRLVGHRLRSSVDERREDLGFGCELPIDLCPSLQLAGARAELQYLQGES